MNSQFRIYDEHALKRRLRIKPMQVAALFIAGSLFGFSFSNISPGGALAATDAPSRIILLSTQAVTPVHSGCGHQHTMLRMSCELSADAR